MGLGAIILVVRLSKSERTLGLVVLGLLEAPARRGSPDMIDVTWGISVESEDF